MITIIGLATQLLGNGNKHTLFTRLFLAWRRLLALGTFACIYFCITPSFSYDWGLLQLNRHSFIDIDTLTLFQR